jgi:hypothetical protein
MNQKVKEFFNSLYHEEEKLIREEYEARKRRGRTAGYRPYLYFKMAPISDYTHFINCEVDSAICPMQWEDLELSIDLLEKRYCKYCDKFVYKVDNEFMIEKMENENKCMAISNSLLEKMNGKMDIKEFEALQNRLAISMLFLVYKYNNQREYMKFIENNLDKEAILKSILLDILNSYDIKSMIEWYLKQNVQLDIILHQVMANINDEEFKNQIEERIISIIQENK